MGKFYFSDDKGISYSITGKGDTIVLIHGYLETKEIWNEFAKKLSSDFRILSIDLPGHGNSDITKVDGNLDIIAELIYRLLKHLGIKKIFLTGHSLGGYITLAFAEKYPEMLSGFCLFHSHPFADTESAISKRKNEIILTKQGKKDQFYPENIINMFASSGREALREKIKDSLKIASGISDEGIISVLEGMMARPSRHWLMEEGKIPCLWILGVKDNYINCQSVCQRINLPQNSKICLLQNSGHMGFIEEEDLSVKILTEFIKENAKGIDQ